MKDRKVKAILFVLFLSFCSNMYILNKYLYVVKRFQTADLMIEILSENLINCWSNK